MLYLFIFFVLLISEWGYFRIADYYNITDRANHRSSHTYTTLRGGGIVFYVGVLIWAIFHGFHYPWFIVGLTLIAVVSFLDDVHSVSIRYRLPCQFGCVLLMFYQWGVYEIFPLWHILIALILCVGIINSYNFMDGINGMTGGYSLVILVSLIYINAHVFTYIESDFLYICLLAVFIFCFFNFRKRAKCFAGDVGSISIAFVILFVLGKLILTTGDLSYIVLLTVYGVDSMMTIVYRLIAHENIFEPHRKHAYQLMANELKVPHVIVSSLYMLLQIVINVFYWLMPAYHWTCFGGSVLFLSIVYILFKKVLFKRFI